MKTLLAKLNNDKRRSPANGSNTSSVGGVTSLILWRSVFILTIIVGIYTVLQCTTTNTYATASTLNLSIDQSTITAHAATNNASGSFVKSTSSTITASTDNYTGYKLIIKGSNNNYASLVNSSDNNEALTSVSSATTEEVFKAVSSTAYNGKWGFLPSKLNSSDNTSFLPAPDNNTGYLINETSTANATGTSDTYTMAIGARVDASTKMGQYSNTYTVIMTANDIAYSITYNDGVVSNMPTDIANGTSPDTTITLANNIPTRNGYAFIGWCDGTITTTNDTDSCTGTTYPAGSNYNLDQLTNNNISLVAMWGPSMQGFAAGTMTTTCSSMSVGDTLTLYDSRDGQEYSVAKLADNKCWMTKNLNIAGGTELSYTDTDFENNYTLPTTNGWTTANNDKLVMPTSNATGFSNDNYAYLYNSNSTVCASGTRCYSYYSWDTATLGSGRIIATDNTNAPYSICPKGWRLPNTIGGTDDISDFRSLIIAIGGSASISSYRDDTSPTGETISAILRAFPYDFSLAGYYYQSAFFDGGSNVGYWSSTSLDNNNAYYLSLKTTEVLSANRYHRKLGLSVRCVTD